MPSLSGFLVSSFLGAAARKLQVEIIGKVYPRSFNRVIPYLLSIGVFTGGYLAIDSILERNNELLQRRLAVLREQRALTDKFFDFETEIREKSKHNLGSFWQYYDQLSAPRK
ncbi:uncharacterized protein SPAPADRAFT_63101 [Spathaspora passalidarum NRRL Y-27907]|uniref:Uncharacterized protein n=1 Tax=Spathaspora passalidarum (strain NRRL Y-27907 / 11-Y1) TaxID=619300 RepID=G3AUH0_SPAPN|nr:uncharacterized protein SPAPADRAFT_63101 [Spathaspora passalidarum NRRL Y-27907]EGW30256.1 hypothetical protein SPAPADRAFT_63101 [Spathaspora passalidarum NRRL Y-27907]